MLKRFNGESWVVRGTATGGGLSGVPALEELANVEATEAGAGVSLVKEVDGIWRPRSVIGDSPDAGWVKVSQATSNARAGVRPLGVHQPGDLLFVFASGGSGAPQPNEGWDLAVNGGMGVYWKTAQSDQEVGPSVDYNIYYGYSVLSVTLRHLAGGTPVVDGATAVSSSASDGYMSDSGGLRIIVGQFEGEPAQVPEDTTLLGVAPMGSYSNRRTQTVAAWQPIQGVYDALAWDPSPTVAVRMSAVIVHAEVA